MSKIICDICGTSYPETAKQCPICGSVQPGDVQRVTNEVKNNGKGSTGYTHVKGGHFTKSSVKKRTKDSGVKPAPKKSSASKGGGQEKDNRGLVITAIVLLLAVIGVVIYIAIGFFKPYANQDDSTIPSGRILCTDIRLTKVDYLLTEAGASELLAAEPDPKNTTDTMTFTSQDPAIVTVDNAGNIQAVSEGTTYIEIRCGMIEKTITVKVEYPKVDPGPGNDENNNGDAENPDVNVDVTGELRFLSTEIKLNNKGLNYSLYIGSVPKENVKFSSENEAVATFKNGTVIAVGEGETTVHAEFNGQKLSCKVICNFSSSGGQTGSGGVSEDGGGTGNTGLYKAKITGDEVRIRNTPEAKNDLSNAVGYLLINDQVTVYEERTFGSDKWCRISADGEAQQWVYGTYVQAIN